MKQSRLDQLADSIFAIVMTLLVFDMRVPVLTETIGEGAFINSMVSMYPLFLSYLLSFSLLFTYWRSHHIIASVLAKNIDITFSNINGAFLFMVALVPFSSHFLGKYLDSKTAVIFFALNIILISLILIRMRQYAIKSKNIENTPFTETENEHANMHLLFPLVSAIIAIGISFYSTKIAIILFTVAILFNLSKNGTKYIFFIINLFRSKKNKSLV
jgi:uncharacterized membrane protein